MPRGDSAVVSSSSIRNHKDRNSTFTWTDKRILRLFRNNLSLPNTDYKKFRDVYTALCEIESDFAEEKKQGQCEVNGLIQTCATYAGMDRENVSQVMQELARLGLIDYGQLTESGRFGACYLTLFVFNENINYRELFEGATVSGNCRQRQKPLAAKTVSGNCRGIRSTSFHSVLKDHNKESFLSEKSGAADRSASSEESNSPSTRRSTAKAAKQRAVKRRRQPDPDIYTATEFFKTDCQDKLGFQPEISAQDYAAVKKHIKTMGGQELRQCLRFFLTSDKTRWSRENQGALLVVALSSKNISLFRASRSSKGERFTPGGGIKGEPGKYAHLSTKMPNR